MCDLAINSKEIHQLDNLYSLNDLHKASGADKKHQPSNFLRASQIKELITEIDNSSDMRSFKKVTGRNGGTYACKELVYAYGMWINAKFHLHVIRAFDQIQQQKAEQPKTLEYQPLSPEQQNQIQQKVNHICSTAKNKKLYPALYARLRNKFRVGKYTQIDQLDFKATMIYLEKLELVYTAPKIKAQPQTKALPFLPENITHAEVKINDGQVVAFKDLSQSKVVDTKGLASLKKNLKILHEQVRQLENGVEINDQMVYTGHGRAVMKANDANNLIEYFWDNFIMVMGDSEEQRKHRQESYKEFKSSVTEYLNEEWHYKND